MLAPWRYNPVVPNDESPRRPNSESKKMVLEIFLDAKGEEKRVLVERWVFSHTDEPSSDFTGSLGSLSPSQSGTPSVPSAYKKLVVMFRVLHAECRALPCHKFARHAAENKPNGFAVSFDIREEDSTHGVEDKPPPLVSGLGGSLLGHSSSSSPSYGQSSSNRSSQDPLNLSGVSLRSDLESQSRSRFKSDHCEYRVLSFADNHAPEGGTLSAKVYFLDADALRALDLKDAPPVREPKILNHSDLIVDSNRVPSRGVAIARRSEGENNYSPSPTDGYGSPGNQRRANSWTARATYFLSTSPGSLGKKSSWQDQDLDTPPPPSRVGISISVGDTSGNTRYGQLVTNTRLSRGGLLSAEMAAVDRSKASSSSAYPDVPVPVSQFVGSPSQVTSPVIISSSSSLGRSARPPLSPLVPSLSSAPAPKPIFGFGVGSGMNSGERHGGSPESRHGSPAARATGLLSALATRLSASPNLPFAIGSFGKGSGSGNDSGSLASPSHQLATRTNSLPAGNAQLGPPTPSPRDVGRETVVSRNVSANSSARVSVGWSSETSGSLSQSLADTVSNVPKVNPLGGPFAHGSSPKFGIYGASPDSVVGRINQGFNRLRIAAPPETPPSTAKDAHEIHAVDTIQPRRLTTEFTNADSDSVDLPFHLDVDDESGQDVATSGQKVESDSSCVTKRDTALADLARLLREAPRLGSDKIAPDMTLLDVKRTLQGLHTELLRKNTVRASASENENKKTDGKKSNVSRASAVIDATVDSAVLFAVPPMTDEQRIDVY